MSSRLVATLLPLMLIGCAPAMYVPTQADVTPGTTLDRLTSGRDLYVAKCGSCHALKRPSGYELDTWKENLDEMQTRARISDEEKQLILEYLDAGSKERGISLHLPHETPIFR